MTPDPIRAKALALVAALDDDVFERRDDAERNLLKFGFDILPLLVPSLESPSVERRLRATRTFHALTAPLIEDRLPIRDFHVTQRITMLGQFEDPEWKAVTDKKGPLDGLRVEAALHGPVPWIQDHPPLPVDAVERLRNQLRSTAPYIRAAAVRSVPRTSNDQLLTALVDRLADPYEAVRRSGPCPHPQNPIAEESCLYAIPFQGKAIIAPLLAFARRAENRGRLWHVYEALGRIGPDPRSLAFVRHRVAARKAEDLFSAVEALAKLGPEAISDLIALADDSKAGVEQSGIRRIAIQGLVHYGNVETVTPFLRKMIRHNDPELADAAIGVVEQLSVREALPDLKHLLEARENLAALGAYVRMADRADSSAVLFERLRSSSAADRGVAALMLAALGVREAIPRLLALLSDTDPTVRTQADRAMRMLTNRPNGVGYDPRKSETSTLWQNAKE